MKQTPAIESKTRELLDDHFKRLRALEYIPKGHLDFFESITKAHYKARDRIGEDKLYPSVGEKTAKEMLSKDFPVMTFEKMRVNMEPLRTHWEEICSILMKYEASEPGEVEAFSKSDEYKELDLKELISKTFPQDGHYLKGLSEKTGVKEGTLAFMAVTLARPLFELAAGEMKETLNDYPWWKNYCPACGNEAFMARIRTGDNMRILACSICGTEWKFDRVTCPFCENKDQKSLKLFYYHEESPHRLYACDKCKRYIKCIDERKMEVRKEINMPAEDMATLYLDTLAKEKGYVSGSVFKDTEGQEDDSKEQDCRDEGGD